MRCRQKIIYFVFQQLKEEKQEISFGFGEAMTKATQEVLKNTFNKLNPA